MSRKHHRKKPPRNTPTERPQKKAPTQARNSIKALPWYGVRIELGRRSSSIIAGLLGFLGAITGLVLSPHMNSVVERSFRVADAERRSELALSEKNEIQAMLSRVQLENDELLQRIPLFEAFGHSLDLYTSINLSDSDTRHRAVEFGDCSSSFGCFRFRYIGISEWCETCYQSSHDPDVPFEGREELRGGRAIQFVLDFKEVPGTSWTGAPFGLALRRNCSFIAVRSNDEMIVRVEETREEDLRIGVVVRPRVTNPSWTKKLPMVFPDCPGWLHSGAMTKDR